MKILVVGSGGREHAIIRKLRENDNPEVGEIYALPGNGGIAHDAVCAGVKATDIAGVTAFAAEKCIDFAVVGPDDPLCMGLVDALEAAGVPAFGPDKKAAAIEGSKIFAKGLMQKYGIPTARWETFGDFRAACDYIDAAGCPVVVKADGLALGKGVFVCGSREEAREAARALMVGRVFGESGARVVIEEFLTGPEVSVLALTDGETLIPLVSAMDHKRAFDGDAGPNTGGMGAIAPSPFYTPEIAEICLRTIFLPTVKAMRAEGRTFKGCLYFGLMLTADGPKVIEYNCRFGDPEAQAVLALLESDLLGLMLAARGGALKDVSVKFREGAACCVVMASGGYPGKYETGFPIEGLDGRGQLPGASVFHAGDIVDGSGRLVTAGGRVLGVTCAAPELKSAVDAAYAAVGRVSFKNMHYRKDIGRK